jgi:hypothetical protein
VSCTNPEDLKESLKPAFLEVCDKEPLRKSILDCIKFGNPKSDEEPEDLVDACYNNFAKIYCDDEKGFVYRTKPYSTFVPCTKAVLPKEMALCEDWGPQVKEGLK